MSNSFELTKTPFKPFFGVEEFVTAYYFKNYRSSKEQTLEAENWEQYPFAQIFVNIEGGGKYYTENEVFEFQAGSMIYRPANTPSCFLRDGVSDFALISFVCSSPAMDGFGTAPILLYGEEFTFFLDLVKTCVRICEPVEGKEGWKGMKIKQNVPPVALGFVGASLERFLSMVYCRMHGISLLLDESQKANSYINSQRLIAEVKEYLLSNIGERLTVEQISSRFGISRSTLTKQFKAATGLGLIEYFNDRKIDNVKILIEKTSLNFTQIAEKLGFVSLNYLSRLFKSKTGLTLTEYSRRIPKRQIISDLEK